MFRSSRRNKSYCALDIGTTKVCALIGRLDEEGYLSVQGVGSSQSRGIRNGEVTDVDKTVDAITRAVSQAEELAKTQVREALVGIAGDHVQSTNVEAVVSVPHANRGIDDYDRSKAILKARQSLVTPANKDIIHAVTQNYIVNGNKTVLNPNGLSSNELGVRLHLIMASIAAMRNLWKCIRRAGYQMSEVALESLASSASVLTEHEKDLGVAMIDIGGGTADAAVFKDGCLRWTGETPLGGDSISHDIQVIWGLSFPDAEAIKKKLGTALPASLDPSEMLELPRAHPAHEAERKKRRDLALIIEARAEEILTQVRESMSREVDLRELHAGIVLTGGSSLLHGMDQVAARIFERKCRLGYPRDVRGMSGVLSSPIYSTAVGLLRLACDGVELNALDSARPPWWRRIAAIF
ncbi:MAG: Cell division protein FtsA [candidate division BRC1 bacterium ADurb.BinA364]|nr:MAG: Cell division protein FtsA [candidate division BRC1 bacterium ADurb.BinA364]